MTAGGPPRSRLAVRDRLRALLPSAEPVGLDEDEPPSRRGLAMLLSLVVALVMWFSFSMRETYSVTMRVPVEVVETPAGQALREPPPETVSALLSGEGWTLLSLTRRVPTLPVRADGPRVDLEAALEAELPAGVTASVQPDVLELALDTRTNRRLPIRLRGDVRAEAPYDLLRPPSLAPDSVNVTGAQSLLAVLDAWPTEPLDADGVTGSFVRTVALADTFGGLLTPAVEATRVRVDVGEFTEGRRNLGVRVVNLPDGVEGVRFEPAQVQAVFRVPTQGPTYDRAVETPAFQAVVDWFDVQRDTTDGMVPVTARWPEGLDVRDVRLEPSRVAYFIRRAAPVGAAEGDAP